MPKNEDLAATVQTEETAETKSLEQLYDLRQAMRDDEACDKFIRDTIDEAMEAVSWDIEEPAAGEPAVPATSVHHAAHAEPHPTHAEPASRRLKKVH
jgi:hypothetical protein